jgi:thiol-disulfide isomerase/thioredoxin
MNRIILLMMLLCAQLANALSSVAIEHKEGFSISGNVQGLKNGENLYLSINLGDKLVMVSRAKVQDGVFTFKDLKLPAPLGLYFISIETEFVDNLQLFLDQGGDVKITGDLKSWPKVEVTGSSSHNEYLAYLKQEQRINREMDSIRYLANSITGFNKSREQAKQLKQAFIKDLSNSDILPFALVMWKDWYLNEEIHPSDKKPYFDRLSERLKNSHYGQVLKKAIEQASEENFMNPGDQFPKITVFDENGKMEHLTDLVKRNKLTLIDCWHSTCKPCRAAFPSIEKTLAKYKRKGFGVIGVSSDEDLAKWKIALEHDKPGWPDYVQDKNSLSKIFELYGKGAYFLVDSEGKVLAFDGPSKIMKSFGGGLSYEELDIKLEELLGK